MGRVCADIRDGKKTSAVAGDTTHLKMGLRVSETEEKGEYVEKGDVEEMDCFMGRRSKTITVILRKRLYVSVCNADPPCQRYGPRILLNYTRTMGHTEE